MKSFVVASLVLATSVSSLVGCANPNPPAVDAAPGVLNVDAAASSFTFVTTKNVNVAEVQQFKRVAGTIAPSGTVAVTVDLSSLETNIPIRNERMLSMLFDVAQFGSGRFDATVDPMVVGTLKVGESKPTEVAGKLTLHGRTQDARASLQVTRLSGDRVLVATRAPVLVSAAAFGLDGGVDRLREIAGLTSISGTVPVTFSLVFAQ